MKKLALLLASLAMTILVGGCGGQGSPAEYPADFKVQAGDASAIVTWTAQPGVEYWIFYGRGDSITTDNWVLRGGSVRANATSPAVFTGLTNGNTYSFTINGRTDGGPGGAGAPTQAIVPTVAGTNWAVGAPLGTGRLNGMASGLGLAGFANVTVGANGAIFTSINGAATTTPTNPAAPADLNAVCYGGLGFVAAGANGRILFSNDGITWISATSGTTASLYGGSTVGTTGGFIAVGAAGTILTSTNGTDWTAALSGTTNNLRAAAIGAGRLVVVGDGGTIQTSADGITWTPAASGTTGDLKGVAYASIVAADSTVTSQFVAVGAAGTVLTSSDGTTWTLRNAISANDLNAVVYGGQFVAVGKAGGIFTSPDGLTWQSRTSGTTNDFAAVARTLLGYTAVGDAGTNVSSF